MFLFFVHTQFIVTYLNNSKIVCCIFRMIKQRTEELEKGFENIGHPLNTYYLINRLYTVITKVSDNSSLASKLISRRVF